MPVFDYTLQACSGFRNSSLLSLSRDYLGNTFADITLRGAAIFSLIDIASIELIFRLATLDIALTHATMPPCLRLLDMPPSMS